MTASLPLSEHTPEQAAQLIRAVLELAAELDRQANRCSDVVARISLRDAGARLRSLVSTVLAADPEPREDVVERMARAMWAADCGLFLDELSGAMPQPYRRLAAAALDAKEGR